MQKPQNRIWSKISKESKTISERASSMIPVPEKRPNPQIKDNNISTKTLAFGSYFLNKSLLYINWMNTSKEWATGFELECGNACFELIYLQGTSFPLLIPPFLLLMIIK